MSLEKIPYATDLANTMEQASERMATNTQLCMKAHIEFLQAAFDKRDADVKELNALAMSILSKYGIPSDKLKD